MGDILGQTIDMKPPTNIFDLYAREPNSTGATFLNGIANMVAPNGPNQAFAGAPAYPGATSPDANAGMLPSVYGSWQPWNAGTSYMANYVGGPGAGQMSPANQTAQSNLAQYGGIGGYPTQLMHGMAQYGGTGGPGNQAMSSMLQFGMPSAAGQPISNMAQTGVSGSWGNPLLALANGNNSAALRYMAPFLGARAYNSGRGA